MKRHALRTFVADGWLVALSLLFALMSVALFFVPMPPVQAAQSAPPEVKECQPVNTATLSNGGVIEVFRCNPEDGAPFLLNSIGFMKDEQ